MPSMDKIYWLFDKPNFVDGKPSKASTPPLDMTNSEMVKERKKYFREEVIGNLQSIAKRRFGLSMATRAILLGLTLETYDESTGTTLRDKHASKFADIPEIFKTKSMQEVYHKTPLKFFKYAWVVYVETSFDKSWKSMSILEFLSGYPYCKKPEQLWKFPFTTVSSFLRILFLRNLID